MPEVTYDLAATLARMKAAERGSFHYLQDPSIEPTYPCWMFEVNAKTWERIDNSFGPRFEPDGTYVWTGWSHWYDGPSKPTRRPPSPRSPRRSLSP